MQAEKRFAFGKYDLSPQSGQACRSIPTRVIGIATIPVVCNSYKWPDSMTSYGAANLLIQANSGDEIHSQLARDLLKSVCPSRFEILKSARKHRPFESRWSAHAPLEITTNA
jgi:hypothetical protein